MSRVTRESIDVLKVRVHVSVVCFVDKLICDLDVVPRTSR